MRTVFLLLFSSVLIIFITLVSCEKPSDKESEMTTSNKINIEGTLDDIGELDTMRISNHDQDGRNISKSTSDINPDDYEIIIRDSYGDYFYVNPTPNINSTVPANYYAYNGTFVHSGVGYKTAIIYYKNTKTLAASLFYYNDQCMVYNARWVSNNYFLGTYAWVKADYDYMYKQRKITCTFTKGAFPGMNDTNN